MRDMRTGRCKVCVAQGAAAIPLVSLSRRAALRSSAASRSSIAVTAAPFERAFAVTRREMPGVDDGHRDSISCLHRTPADRTRALRLLGPEAVDRNER
jgi:hypothetical protein